MAGEEKGVIRVISKKHTERAESISINATGKITFASAGSINLYGAQGGVTFGNYEPLKKKSTVGLLVKKVEGPFDAKGNLVTRIEKGVTYAFKATEFTRKPSDAELLNLKWSYEYDESGELQNLKVSEEIKNGIATKRLFIPEEATANKIRVYAYFKNPAKTASVTADLKGAILPIYVDRYKIKGKDRKGEKIADDMCYGDGITQTDHFKYTRKEIEDLGWMMEDSAQQTDDVLWQSLEQMVTELFSIGELEDVALKMLDKFKRSEGGEFTNSILTKHVEAHESTNRFCSSIEDVIADRLNKYKGDVEKIEDSKIYDSDKATGKFGDRGFGHPRFSTLGDTFAGGLTICMNDTWAYEVFLTKYKKTGPDIYQATYKVILYDHFGLDKPDVEKKYYYLAGFRSWFVLQHLRGYKPFITKVAFERSFWGNLKKGKAEREKERMDEWIREEKRKMWREPKF